MSRCHPEARTRARRAQRELREYRCVEAVDLLTPAVDPSDRWTLDIMAWSETDLVPWQVARVLGEYRLDHRAGPRVAAWSRFSPWRDRGSESLTNTSGGVGVFG